MATFYERPERGWTPIPDELIQATELSPVARLVLMHAMSNRADWEEPAWKIAERLGLSRERVINALAELKKTGHARKTATVTVPGRPPRQGWDFAWPSFVEVTGQSRVSPSSENPTMAEDPQVEAKVGFHHDGETRRRETPSSGFPTSGNPSPLLDQGSNKTVDQPDQPTNKTKEMRTKPHDPAPEEAPVALLNLNDFDDLPSAPAKPRRPRASQPTDDPDFDRAWEAYGHKVDRVQARKAWIRALKKAPAEVILAAIPAYVAVTTGKGEPEGTGTAWKPRRKNLATWLNNEGWTEEIEPPKKGYQGQAGSDLGPAESYENAAKHLPIHRLARLGPMGNDWEMNFAWYYHWNVQEQREWTVEQMLETGNTPEDVEALMDAYANGIDPQLYQRLLDDYNIPPHGSDA